MFDHCAFSAVTPIAISAIDGSGKFARSQTLTAAGWLGLLERDSPLRIRVFKLFKLDGRVFSAENSPLFRRENSCQVEIEARNTYYETRA